MRSKNYIFAEALDWIVKNKGVNGQKGIARATGISENTISRIITGKVQPSDDTLRKISELYGFNMAWLRGEEDADMFIESNTHESPSDLPTSTELYDMMLKEKDERIRELQIHIDDQRIELANKDRTIQSLVQQMATLNARLAAYQQSSLDNYPFHVGVSEPNPTRV